MESELTKSNEEYKKHSGGVNKALIRKRRDPRQGKQETGKKQAVKKRLKMDHFRNQVPRTPLHLSVTSFPNLNIDFHNGREAPMFLDTAHAQKTIVQVLSQYYLREENESICGRDEVLDGSEISCKSEASKSDSDSIITTEAYLQEAYNYLYHQHVNTLTKLVGEAKLENIESNTKKRLHIGQHYFLQNNENDDTLKSPTDSTHPQVANEDSNSNDEASEASDFDDNEEKQKQILSSIKEHLERSQAIDQNGCTSNSLPENCTSEKPEGDSSKSENIVFEDFKSIQITTTSPTLLSESRTESLDYSNHLADYEDYLIHRDSEDSTAISRPNSSDSLRNFLIPE